MLRVQAIRLRTGFARTVSDLVAGTCIGPGKRCSDAARRGRATPETLVSVTALWSGHGPHSSSPYGSRFSCCFEDYESSSSAILKAEFCTHRRDYCTEDHFFEMFFFGKDAEHAFGRHRNRFVFYLTTTCTYDFSFLDFCGFGFVEIEGMSFWSF